MTINNEISLLVSSDPSQGASQISTDGASFSINLGTDGIKIPKNAYNVKVSVESASVWWSVPNILDSGSKKNNLLTITGPNTAGVLTTFNIAIIKGLYDLSGLNGAIQRELENLGAKIDPLPIIALEPDENTQRVNIVLNYLTSSVSFPNGSPYEILGFNLGQTVSVPAGVVPYNALAPNVANFNTTNFFLIHTDLIQKGIRFNNNYSGIIAQVLINKKPGSQILYEPLRAPIISANELVGTNRNSIRFWLTNDKNELVDTNDEYWSARLAIRWNE